MPRQRIPPLFSFLLAMALVLVACAGTAETPSPVASTPTPRAQAQAETTATVPGPLPTASPSPTEPLPPTVEPTPIPVRETPTPEPMLPTGSLWPNLLRELDFGLPAGNSYSPRSMAIHPDLDRLYVRTHSRDPDPGEPGWITVLDLSDGQVLEIAGTGPDLYSEGSVVVDATLNRVYALNPGDSTLSVLDAESLDPVRVLPDVRGLALDAEAGRLYVAGVDSLRELDSSTYELLREAPQPGGLELLAFGIDPEAGTIYLAQGEMGSYTLTFLDADSLAPISAISLPGRPDALLPDPDRGRLYVTLNDSTENLLWTLDSSGHLLEERALGEWTQRTLLALDPGGERLILGRDAYGQHGISVIDLKTGTEIGQVPLDRAPNALAWNGDEERLLVSHTYQDRIRIVDLPRGTPLRGHLGAEFATARELVDMGVDPGRGHLYVTDSLGQLHVLDRETGLELATLPGEGLIAVDGMHGRFYTGGEGADRVRIFDSDRLQETGAILTEAAPVADAHNGELYLVQQGIYLASLDTYTTTAAIPDTLPQNPGFSPNPAAIGAVVDPGSGRVFAIVSNGVPGSNAGTYLYVYEPETFEKVLDDTERSPWYLDVDPETGRAFVSRAHMTGRSTSLLEEGREYVARLEGVFGALRVDPSLGRVYLTVRGDHEGQMLVLDAENLNVLGAVPVPSDFTLRALDTDEHLLYLGTEDGKVQVWSATGGDLPPAADPVPADLAAAGPHRLYVAPGDLALFARDGQNLLYRSDDEGDSWGRVAGGLPEEWVLDVAFSPDFETDQTLFAAVATADQGYGVWRSTDGGRSWRVTSLGLTDLAVVDLAISPAFGDDGTLFALARRDGLFRTTDGGESWQPLVDRYRPPDAAAEQPGQFIISPAFGDDRSLGIEHYGLHGSTDGGETWHAIDVSLPGYGSGYLAFSPQHATDQAMYYLWLPSEEGFRAEVYGSLDSGVTWTEVGPGPPVAGWGSRRAMVSPDATLYVVWRPLSTGEPAQMYRSTGLLSSRGMVAEVTWERLAEAPFDLFAAELADDGAAFVALDQTARLMRWPAADLLWVDAVLPEPSPDDTAVPTSIPPTPVPCAMKPERFRSVWQQARSGLGCAEGSAVAIYVAEQPFEQGHMIWDSDSNQIYVLLASGDWQAHVDTFVEGIDPAWDANLLPPPLQPQRGFGKVWRDQLGGPRSVIGWALEGERPVDGWRQRFERGLLLWTDAVPGNSGDAGTAYLLYKDGTWGAVPAPRP